MELQCQSCQRVLEYSGEAPKFCGHCGQSLTDTGIGDATVTHISAGPVATSGEAPAAISGYRLMKELGRGGMGVVYQAEQEGTGRHVAIKLLPPHVHRTDETIQRFLQEGELAASLSHPRSTFVYSAGEENGQFFIVMELMPGGTLKDVVDDEGALPIAQAVDYILDVIEGLEAAHASGVVHRDVKPSNCFVDAGGRAKVGDYGLSKSLVSDSSLTRTGAFMGTPQFAAPEQIKGGKIDERTDIYAIGATLYYLVAGQAPFQGDAARVIAGIAAESPPPLSKVASGVPQQLERIVTETLAKEPDDRPASMTVLRSALLPFSSRGCSIADLGRRLAAYFIDAVVAGIIFTFVLTALNFGLVFAGMKQGDLQFLQGWTLQLSLAGLAAFISIAYFTIAESWFTRGVGKRLMGLRVVTDAGEVPSAYRSLGRAMFFPGVMAMCSRVLPLFMGLTPMNPSNLDVAELMWALTMQSMAPVIGWVLSLLCLVTMKHKNGYRGLHELVTGTRVIRAAAARQRAVAIPQTVPAAIADLQLSIPGYRIVGQMGERDGVTVYAAIDEGLNRSAWIVTSSDDAELFASRRVALSRPSRAFWLQGGEVDGRRWDVIEAVRGGPIDEVIASRREFTWTESRVALRELCDELLAGLDDDTLPAWLTSSQVWLDSQGRVKLLDVPLASKSSAVDIEQHGSATERCVVLLRTLLSACRDRQLLPAHALDFAAELETREATRETLSWAREQLECLAHRHTTLNWDDRLGVIAVAMSTELVLLSPIAVIAGVLATNILPLTLAWSAAVVVMLLIAGSIGFFGSGGPVLYLTGVSVRDKRGHAASRLRCGIRSLLVWLPWSMVQCSGAIMLVWNLQGNGQFDLTTQANVGLFIMVITGAFGGMLVHLAGSIFAVASPRRGLQDFVAGTRLVPS